MAFFHPKVLEDLEFNRILSEIAENAFTERTRNSILQIKPADHPNDVWENLQLTDEYLKSIQSGNPFPHHEFSPYGEEIKKLKTENYYLSPETFLAIAQAMEITIEWKKFLNNFHETYPYILDNFSKIKPNKDIVKAIRSKISREGTVKDKASETLFNIREEIKSVKRKRSEIFNQLVKKYDKAGYLDEIKESIVDNRPVLAVSAAYRKKIKGDFAATSRSGNIVFIEPEETSKLSNKIQQLHADEQAEIIQILKDLSNYLKAYSEDLIELENFLFFMDRVQAQAKFAHKINAVLPEVSQTQTLDLKKAYHPVLLIENQKKGISTVPQDIFLNQEKRILVISGPNAGGKSITLKTVGLLQLMFQSGLLIPVSPGSKLPFFKKILTDIGDNQSIENQLSTYSYRLRNMRLFLKLADNETLILIDEFGTGSDPELGGALAEVFLEIFNRKKVFGVITTHYNNLKILAEKLDGTVNAHMEFDMKTLSPTYRLHTGEPGSSYTFEVARKMGIPYSIINRAKHKVDKKKVRFDQTLSDIHSKQKKLREEILKYKNEREELAKQLESYRDKELQILKKLNAFRELYEEEKRKTDAGERILNLFKEFQKHRNEKKLWKELDKWMKKEGIKQIEKKPTNNKTRLKKTKQTILNEIRKEDVKKKLEQLEIKQMEYKPQIGDKVRLSGSQATAYLTEIRGTKAILDYGKFKAEVPLKNLELVMRKN